MSFPKKYQKLIDITASEVEKPDRVMLTYCVCGCSSNACGWVGWLLEDVVKINTKGKKKKSLSFDNNQKCPACGLVVFRTNVQILLSRCDQKEIDTIWPDSINFESVKEQYD